MGIVVVVNCVLMQGFSCGRTTIARQGHHGNESPDDKGGGGGDGDGDGPKANTSELARVVTSLLDANAVGGRLVHLRFVFAFLLAFVLFLLSLFPAF